MATINSSAINSAVNQVSAENQRSVLVLKKALDSQAQTAAALIQALPQPPSASGLPPNLGRTINTAA